MNFRNSMLSLVFLSGLWLTELYAQEAIPAAGGNAAGNGGTTSYSVGQIVYTTNVGATSTIAQGVQHPYEILVLTSIEQAAAIQLRFTAYPNPTTDMLMLGMDGLTTLTVESLSYQLYDISGKLLKNGQLKDSYTSIDMSPFVPATYLLTVSQTKYSSSQNIKTFKIIKK